MVPLLAQESAPPAPPTMGLLDILIPGLLIYLIFWVLVIRPQRRSEKEKQARIEALQKGDRVRTRGGVIGTVTRVKDDEIVLRTGGDSKVQITFAKTYVEEVLSSKEGEGA